MRNEGGTNEGIGLWSQEGGEGEEGINREEAKGAKKPGIGRTSTSKPLSARVLPMASATPAVEPARLA